MAETWLRIYSTNYDDAAEFQHLDSGRVLSSFDVSQPIPNRFPKNSIVHLHGSIRTLTPENITTSLVLGETSYIRQYLQKSPWYNQFQADVKFASKLIVVGYSLSDYHISALLMENPDLASKTFFVQSNRVDPVFSRRTSSYGTALFIGVKGLAEAIRVLPRPAKPSDVTRLKSFKYLDPLRDNKAVRAPTANEVLELLIYGSFNYARCVSTLPEQTYVISREKEIRDVVTALSENRSAIIDSRLGNGKTIFLHLCFIELASQGYNCFLFKGFGPEIDAEIDLLRHAPRPVIIFDQFTMAQDIIARLGSEIPAAKFIVEVRTSILEVRYHDLLDSVPRPFVRVGVNKLSPADVAAFRELCRKAGLASGVSISRTTVEMRDVLLELFESEQIKDRIRNELSSVFSNEPRRKVLLLTMLLSTYQVSADPSFIRTVTGVDPYHEFKPVQEIADEVFELSADAFRMRSSIFSEYAVRHFMTPNEIADCVVSAALAAAERKSSRQYRVLMSNLLQYSNLHETLKSHKNASFIVLDIYERLRYDERINDEPLFWLQYAIAMAERGRLLPAREFIKTAYDRAADRPGFQTYQIDTQAFRILLLTEIDEGPGKAVAHFDEIIKMLELFDSMLNEESHRSFAIKVLEGISPLIDLRRGDFSSGEKVALAFWLSRLSATLSRLPADYRARTGSDLTRAAIDQAIRLLG